MEDRVWAAVVEFLAALEDRVQGMGTPHAAASYYARGYWHGVRQIDRLAAPIRAAIAEAVPGHPPRYPEQQKEPEPQPLPPPRYGYERTMELRWNDHTLQQKWAFRFPGKGVAVAYEWRDVPE